MRVEIFARVWFCDKKHNKCKVPYAVQVEKERNKAVVSLNNSDEKTQEYIEFLRNTARFIHYHTFIELKPIVFIDINLHQEHDGYAIAIAYAVMFGNIKWRAAYKYMLQKVLPFQFSDFHEKALHLLEKMYKGMK